MTVNFETIKFTTNGMLDPEVYKGIHECARQSKADIVEVGTSSGAATISAALGARPGIRVKTIERLVSPSGWSRWGTNEQYTRLIDKNFRTFGIEETVDSHVGTSQQVAPKLDLTNGIGMLILDADGAIDRDFMLFYDALLPGSAIVIDDYKNALVSLHHVNGSAKVFVDQKHKLTKLLVDYFEGKGYIERSKIIGDTYFGFKPKTSPSSVNFNQAEILEIYRQLTFGEGKVQSRLFGYLSKLLKRNMPRTHFSLKRLTGRVSS